MASLSDTEHAKPADTAPCLVEKGGLDGHHLGGKRYGAGRRRIRV